jgi:hypothetical protein
MSFVVFIFGWTSWICGASCKVALLVRPVESGEHNCVRRLNLLAILGVSSCCGGSMVSEACIHTPLTAEHGVQGHGLPQVFITGHGGH